MTKNPAIRRLGPDDAVLWREIRLAALRNAPEAFGDTFEHASTQSIEHFSRAVSGPHPIFAACVGKTLCGTAGFYLMGGPKVPHRGQLWGMFVSPEHRKTGIGKACAMLQTCERHAFSMTRSSSIATATACGALLADLRGLRP